VWYGPWPKSTRKRLRLFVMRALCYLLAVDLGFPGIVAIGKNTR
jgi:hypothetical protein